MILLIPLIELPEKATDEIRTMLRLHQTPSWLKDFVHQPPAILVRGSQSFLVHSIKT